MDERTKRIPYPPETHPDSQNYGFRSLKGKPDRAAKIKEANGFPGMIAALRSLNSDGSPFFSIGCEKYIGPQEFGGFYARGYIEFAYNYSQLVNFAQTADLFRVFSAFCSAREIDPRVTYNFDLQPAHFATVNTDGYSCCLWTRTGDHASIAEAKQSYNDAVKTLAEFFDGWGPPSPEPKRIY